MASYGREVATRRRVALVAVAVAVAGAAPRSVRALEHETRIWPISGMPLVVGPSRYAQAWVDAAATFDFAPLDITLTDGRTWHRSAATPRWDFTAGATVGPFSGALLVGYETIGTAVQLDLQRGDGARLGITATGRLGVFGGYDVSLVPAYSGFLASGRHGRLVAFAAARVRWGQTRYEVQGWDADHAGPYAIVMTRDVALAPMGGLAALWRWAELRMTAGWEIFAVNQVAEWEERRTEISRSGGPFVVLALRGRLGGPQ